MSVLVCVGGIRETENCPRMSEPTEASAPSKEKEDVAEIETSASSEESLQWLRDHGVTVETPEDRVSIKKAAVSLQSLKASDPNTR